MSIRSVRRPASAVASSVLLAAGVLLAGCAPAERIAAPAAITVPRAPVTPVALADVSRGGGVVISQVYGGGGNAGAPYRNDFVELFNAGPSAVSISGWSVQYSSASGTGLFNANGVTTLSGTLQPGQYYLVQLAGGSTGGPLPTADATGTSNLSGTAGKVVLVDQSAGLACNGSSTPCSADQTSHIVDLVGFGAANYFEGAAPTATLSNTTAAQRKSTAAPTRTTTAPTSASSHRYRATPRPRPAPATARHRPRPARSPSPSSRRPRRSRSARRRR